MRRWAIPLTAFVLQLLVLGALARRGSANPYAGPRASDWVLAPGVLLFWDSGVHSPMALVGLPLALLLDTALYALPFYVAAWLLGRRRTSSLTNR